MELLSLDTFTVFANILLNIRDLNACEGVSEAKESCRCVRVCFFQRMEAGGGGEQKGEQDEYKKITKGGGVQQRRGCWDTVRGGD